MALHQEVLIRRQQAKVTSLVNQSIANCKTAIASDEESIFFPTLPQVHAEMVTLLRMVKELELTTDKLVNGR